ncbi:MAG: hypothetical protein BZY75_05240 [SAR202 cluster bacterium Io17-Chloro-G7]|nr:MAG: hypothetical protein BZY75_05240 [SAR202 cluster bacterium Io17-Chloro-G7]
MGRIPTLRATDVIRALGNLGFQTVRQRSSHIIMRHPDQRVVTVPVHSGQDIGGGLLRKILRDAEVTTRGFLTAIRH